MKDGGGGAGILVLAELVDNDPSPLAFELLGLARRLAAPGAWVGALVLATRSDAIAPKLIAHGADRVYAITNPDLAGRYDSDTWLSAVTTVVEKARAGLILAGHTTVGSDVGARLAFRLHAAVATGCEKVESIESSWLATRPCYGNKAREVVALATTPSVVTVKSKTQEPIEEDPSRRGEVIEVTLVIDPATSRTKVIRREREQNDAGSRLESAGVVVAGGRGLGGAEGFRVLEALAETLGGAVGASRVACDLGWCHHSMQIGLTGKTVTPSLYIAVGISGASHHMAGCGNAKAILAINSDPEAAIFKEARYGVVGDYKEIIPALTEEFRRVKAQQG